MEGSNPRQYSCMSIQEVYYFHYQPSRRTLLLALDYSLGKTLTTLLFIARLNKECRKYNKEHLDNPKLYYATLIVVLGLSIDVWQSDAARFYRPHRTCWACVLLCIPIQKVYYSSLYVCTALQVRYILSPLYQNGRF
jgi:hypothetical protein